MMMTLEELKQADEARRRYERARQIRQALRDQLLVGILIDRSFDAPRPIELKHGSGSGTGTITSIGFPDDLQVAMQSALETWADGRVLAAQFELRALGIVVE